MKFLCIGVVRICVYCVQLSGSYQISNRLFFSHYLELSTEVIQVDLSSLSLNCVTQLQNRLICINDLLIFIISRSEICRFHIFLYFSFCFCTICHRHQLGKFFCRKPYKLKFFLLKPQNSQIRNEAFLFFSLPQQ